MQILYQLRKLLIKRSPIHQAASPPTDFCSWHITLRKAHYLTHHVSTAENHFPHHGTEEKTLQSLSSLNINKIKTKGWMLPKFFWHAQCSRNGPANSKQIIKIVLAFHRILIFIRFLPFSHLSAYLLIYSIVPSFLFLTHYMIPVLLYNACIFLFSCIIHNCICAIMHICTHMHVKDGVKVHLHWTLGWSFGFQWV